MLLELILLFEFIAFTFLALGMLPYKPLQEGGNLPLVNKILFILVSAIIFFVLAVATTTYEYTYCYVDHTNLTSSVAASTATCASHLIESTELGYLNMGFGIVSVMLGLIIMIMTIATRHDNDNRDDGM
jgi:hypothetical protein